jgi:hypothetical protein
MILCIFIFIFGVMDFFPRIGGRDDDDAE